MVVTFRASPSKTRFSEQQRFIHLFPLRRVCVQPAAAFECVRSVRAYQTDCWCSLMIKDFGSYLRVLKNPCQQTNNFTHAIFLPSHLPHLWLESTMSCVMPTGTISICWSTRQTDSSGHIHTPHPVTVSICRGRRSNHRSSDQWTSALPPEPLPPPFFHLQQPFPICSCPI